MSNHTYDRKFETVTINGPVRVELTLSVQDPSGSWLPFKQEEHEVQPGSSVTWTYPEDGIKVTMS